MIIFRLCSQNNQYLLLSTTLTVCFFITDVQSVYSAVRTESLYNTDTFVFNGLNIEKCVACI
jgi:hypothetical protein